MKKLLKLTEVNVAKLKNELSAYLALVKQGQSVLVKEHQVPIAKVIPLDDSSDDDFIVVTAKKSLKSLKTMASRKGTMDVDSLTGLLIERARM
ncbi:MAG: type II toxin-antitoxin system prevent-host-death family antitoxin [Bdellovibrionota bacterium]